MTIDLQHFCGHDPLRFWLMTPFSQAGYTWATDANIMLRVPEIPGIGKLKSAQPLNVFAPLRNFDEAIFAKPAFDLPTEPDRTGICVMCDGRGVAHDCPECDCNCRECQGSGKGNPEHLISTTVAKHIFKLAYVRMVASLPDVEIGFVEGEMPMFFRFTGGVGALMPLRRRCDRHIEVDAAPPPPPPRRQAMIDREQFSKVLDDIRDLRADQCLRQLAQAQPPT